MRHFFFLVVLIFFTLMACKKDRLNDGKYALLVGKWTWIYSIHQYGWCDNQQLEEVLTPYSENKNYSIEFLTKGKINFFENDILTSKRRIVFSYFDENEVNGLLFEIDLNNNPDDKLLGGGNADTIWMTFPYNEPVAGCGVYINYFVKY